MLMLPSTLVDALWRSLFIARSLARSLPSILPFQLPLLFIDYYRKRFYESPTHFPMSECLAEAAFDRRRSIVVGPSSTMHHEALAIALPSRKSSQSGPTSI